MFAGLIWIYNGFLGVPARISDRVYFDVYEQRFIGNPNCFAYQDPETGNIYPGVIDIFKFNDERLNTCYAKNENSRYEFLLTLNYGKEKKEIRTENYMLLSKQKSVYVLVYDGTGFISGQLLIGMEGWLE
jgi:hypothetical protein